MTKKLNCFAVLIRNDYFFDYLLIDLLFNNGFLKIVIMHIAYRCGHEYIHVNKSMFLW